MKADRRNEKYGISVLVVVCSNERRRDAGRNKEAGGSRGEASVGVKWR